MELEIRRVQKTGASTMTVSLPKEWIDGNGIKPGDPVEVKVLSDGTISIDPQIKRESEATRMVIEIDADEPKEHLTRKLIGAYLAGFDVVEVRSKDRLDIELKRTVKEISRMVIGPEVMEETSNTVVLHDLSDPVELPQEKCVRRMHLIVSSMHRDAVLALTSLDEELADDVMDRDPDVDRLFWMASKQYNLILKDRRLAEKLGVDIFYGMSLMLVARGVERIGDHAEKIAKNAVIAIRAGKPFGDIEEIVRHSESSLSILDSAMQALFKHDIEGANLAIDAGEKLVEEVERLYSTMQSPSKALTVAKTSILDSITRTTMYAADIAEIAINNAMRGGQVPSH
jgi:phosphate uptake regulator